MNRTAVVLFQLGGPDSLEAVEPFLCNLFCDPDIIDLPGAFLFRKPLARIISRRRAPVVQELYRRIGGKSPIRIQTELQADSLREELAKRGHEMNVVIAMRYWHPMTGEAVRQLVDDGIERVILLPLYPHYSRATTGSAMNEWVRAMRRLNGRALPYRLIHSYPDHPLLIDAFIERIETALRRVPETDRAKIHLVFSAHGTPMKLVRQGDPYSHQIRQTVDAIVTRARFGLPYHLCFQSKVGPQKWLEPSLIDTLDRLAAEGVSHLIVVPVAFVTDHIETLSEINIEAREHAIRKGIAYFDMMPALIRSPKFIACLADLVIGEINRA